MPHLLHLDSAISPVESRSRTITAAFTQAWEAQGDDFTVTYRDLQRDPLPHLASTSLHWAASLRHAGDSPDDESAALQDLVIAELLVADVLVIGAPMYNFSIPSTLKTWIDHIHVPGLTAPFGTYDTQPLAGRTAVLVGSQGGAYDPGTPSAAWDHTLPPLELVLGGALGMNIEKIVVSRTLAHSVGEMAKELPRAEQEFQYGIDQAKTAGARLGRAAASSL